MNVNPPRFFGLKFGPLDKTSFRPLGDSIAGKLPEPLLRGVLHSGGDSSRPADIQNQTVGNRFAVLGRKVEREGVGDVGVSVVRMKLSAFILAALIAGVAGTLSAYRFGSVTSDYFGDIQSLTFFSFAYLGGLGCVGGAIAAGLFVPGGLGTLMSSEWLGIPNQYVTLVGGIGLILTVVFNPDGVAPKVIEDSVAMGRRVRDRWHGWRSPPALPGGLLPDERESSPDSMGAVRVGHAAPVVSPGSRIPCDDQPADRRCIRDLWGDTSGRFSVDLARVRVSGRPHRSQRSREVLVPRWHNRSDPGPRPGPPGGTGYLDLSAHRRARLGLRRTWQSVELFEDLTVAENLAVSVQTRLTSGLGGLVKPRRDELRALSLEALSMFALERSADEMPYSLSLGHQKLVGVARALIAKPGVLGLDEPAAGTTLRVTTVWCAGRSVVEAGAAVRLSITHGPCAQVCDYVYVLDFGQNNSGGHSITNTLRSTSVDRVSGRRGQPGPIPPPR